MLFAKRFFRAAPLAWITLPALAGAAFLWGASLLVADMANALKSQSDSHELLAYLSQGRHQLEHLERDLAALAESPAGPSGNRQSSILEIQTLYQSLVDSLQVAGNGGPDAQTHLQSQSQTQTQTHQALVALTDTIRTDLQALRPAFAALGQNHPQDTAAHLTAALNAIQAHMEPADWHLIQAITQESQSHIDKRAAFQLALVAGLTAAALLLLAVSLVLGTRLKKQCAALRQYAQKTNKVQLTDGLTELPNRYAFLQMIEEASQSRQIEGPRRCPDGGAAPDGWGIVVLKLSGLKRVNIQFGYSYGDDVIARLGADLSGYVRELDGRNRIARTGSVEFSFLIHDITSEEELAVLAHMLLAIVAVPVERHAIAVTLDGYAGIATSQAEGLDSRELVLRADLAMQEAARKGTNEVARFSQPLQAGQIRRRKIEDTLRGAIETNQIYPVYQPQFDMMSGEMVGMEALARWNSPEFGMVPPLEFIEAAERVGGILEIGRHILQRACEDVVTMRGTPSVSVNLSVLQIVQDDVPAFARQVLDETGLEPVRLKLEVTESVLISDGRRVHDTLTQLKRLGISISLDDFGTGYSALSYLTDFDWDELKIDRSFVAKALNCDKARHVATTVGALAGKMDACLTVEGIETSPQRDLFAAIGYRVAQGYFYAKPMDFRDLNASPYILTSRNTHCNIYQ